MPQSSLDCDVLVIGAGAAGLAAAVTAATLGLKVIMVEKAETFGGTSAMSGGWVWVPCSRQAVAAGVIDDRESARLYLENEIGNRFAPALVDAYLDYAPLAFEFLEKHSELVFDLGPAYPDYHPEGPGGLAGGRSLVARPYDGRKLGSRIAELRPVPEEMTFYGMMVGSGADLKHFSRATRSLESAIHVGRLLMRYASDRLIHGRSMRLTNGNALIARLVVSAISKGVEIYVSCPAIELIGGTQVTGATVVLNGEHRQVRSRCGVVLAGGGFGQVSILGGHSTATHMHASTIASSVTGDTIHMAERLGADLVLDQSQPAAWVPVSLVPRRNGEHGAFPHFADRAKPGTIAVRANGTRFVNETLSYHEFVEAMIADAGYGSSPACWLICDHRAIRKYGLGHVKPFPVPLNASIASGYLVKGDDLEELALKCGIDPQGLITTISDFNRDAQAGIDRKFGRGLSAYGRYLGDSQKRPNPCVAPLDNAPYYAIRLWPGKLGTFEGLAMDQNARVLTKSGKPIDGLYVAGNDAASIMGGTYPGAGITLGPAITFGYLAARHAASLVGFPTQ